MKPFLSIKTTKFVYLIVFISLASWSIFAYKTINDLNEEQKIYAKLINISGKQRMLSQKTTLFAKRSFESKKEEIKEHFSKLVTLMKSDHEFILDNLTSVKIRDIYFNAPNYLDSKVRDYFNLLEAFEKNPTIKIEREIEESSFKLLPILNYAVYQFEDEINKKTKELQTRELYILIGALLTLLLEAIFIVVPSVKATEHSLKVLSNANKNLEERVQEKLKKIKEKDELLYYQARMITINKLIDNIAHYWRQPLSMITTAATGILVKKEYEQLNDEELEENLNKIVDNSVYLSNVIERYRSLFEMRKNKNSFFMKELYKKAVNIISNKTQEYNINLVDDIEDINFNGYESDLIQVLVYIYENAKDVFLERDIEKKYIYTNIRKRDNRVFIVIKDSAGGIHKNIIDKIFEPYFTTKDKRVGTGIDLYISKQILKDRFHGDIKVENSSFTYKNEQFSGASFIITIPIL